MIHRRAYAAVIAAAVGALLFSVVSRAAAGPSYAEVIGQTQPKIVKIYGAGGFRGLESYQSGFLISPEGHIVTVWSYVLDSSVIKVVLDDGRGYEAELIGADPTLEVAVLKIDAEAVIPFDLDEAIEGKPGDRVLAFSNLYGVATGNEPASVQRGVISAVTELDARKGVFETPFRGKVYVTDAITNNPGAAGGALTDHQGRLLGMLGKELKNAATNTWLNYTVPVAVMREAIDDIKAGKIRSRRDDALTARNPMKLTDLGLVLVPNVVENTPPFVDGILPGSAAAEAGVEPDDLLLFIDQALVRSANEVSAEMQFIENSEEIKLTVMRGQDFKTFTLQAPLEKINDE